MSKSLTLLNDYQYCKLTFLLKQKRLPNLKNPVYFNDKLLYMKLSIRNPMYKKLVDKYEVREHVRKMIGEEYLIPLLGVYSDPSEVDFGLLPNKFALKLTHTSQTNIICTNKSELDWQKASNQIRKWLRMDFYMRTREWQYKDLKHRFVIEQHISDSSGKLNDYKFWCFDGNPELVQVDIDRFSSHKRNYYEAKHFSPIELTSIYNKLDSEIKKPKNYDEMLKIAKKLSDGFSFSRIDLYNLDGKIYFGEITFYPDNCNGKFTPFEYEKKLGELLVIPQL